MEELRLKTRQVTRKGDPNSVAEQFKFRISSRKAAFYWSEDSFVLFLKPRGNTTFFQVVFCSINIENEKVKIHIQPTLNRITYFLNYFITAAMLISLLIGLILRQEAFLALPIMFPFVALVGWLVNRHNRKETKWFLDDLVAEIQAQ
jgi:hypothetical protein